MVNASSVSGLASKVARTLKHDGYTTGAVRDRVRGEPTSTTIEYAPGADADAREVASLLGIDAPDKPNRTLQFGHIEVVVDDNFSVPSRTNPDARNPTSPSTIYGSYGWKSSNRPPTPPSRPPIRVHRSTAAACPASTDPSFRSKNASTALSKASFASIIAQ